jgi:DNA-binding NarL/FixJ family response regulator
MVGLYHGSHLVAAFGTGTPEDKIIEVALRHAAPWCAVSDRELHILLQFLRTGASPAEIARSWGTTPGEVRRTVRAAVKKLAIHKKTRKTRPVAARRIRPKWRPEMEPATPSPGVEPCEVGNPPRP